MPSHTHRRALGALCLTLSASAAAAAPTDTRPATPDAPAGQVTTLQGLKVSADAPAEPTVRPRFPATAAIATADQVRETVNAVDVEDAAKYLPGVFIRKRNFGDTQPVLATRSWGVNSSARTLVYIDDIPVSALIANNNTIGAPRWGMASPEAIDHVEMLYGPYSAAYAGNAMGGVMRIVTRMPEHTEFTVKQTFAVQSFDLYGTHDSYSTSQTSLTAGGRQGRLGWFVGATATNSFSEPLSFITSAGVPDGTDGAYPARNKTGQAANVLGAGGLLHTRMLNLNGKLEYALTPWLKASYLAGYWTNDGHSRAESYLRDGSGQPTYAGIGGFASNTYGVQARHLMQAASLKTDTHGDFDGEAVVTRYAFLADRQWSPASVAGGTTLSDNGRLASYAGTGWRTVDLSGTWRPLGYGGGQEISLGAHDDRYSLDNPTYNLLAWRDRDSVGALSSAGRGKTTIRALWLQDAWAFAPDWLLTLGGRQEWWQARDGFNLTGGAAVAQPRVSHRAFSPKATLQWDLAPGWRITGSLAKAVRFPTVGELYQLVSTGATYASPNPDLRPERTRSGELAFERFDDAGSARLSLFQENTRDALVQQTAFLATYPVPVNYVTNVGEIRNRGIELAMQRKHVLLRGLELSGSITFVDSTTLSNDRFASSAGTTADGKHAPYVPRWRATAVATYRPDDRWALTVAGRYSGRQYSTLDNTDNTHGVFGAFDSFTLFDARVQYRIDEHLTAGVGVDNLNDRRYFLYHPFPQRTWVADLRLSL
ncbi:TonB-dependent receptor [Dyella sp. KULCS107]|uniref:TonB-dependent receptor n=1 Tax=Dyella sp. KULCS107 TaxID=3422216 RepID=UPI003D6DF199